MLIYIENTSTINISSCWKTIYERSTYFYIDIQKYVSSSIRLERKNTIALQSNTQTL